MKVRDVMQSPVICVGPGQTVESAAKVLERYRIGALPVCTSQGMLCGMVTDRDLVVRCLAVGKLPSATCVREIMTKQVICGSPSYGSQEGAAFACCRGWESERDRESG